MKIAGIVLLVIGFMIIFLSLLLMIMHWPGIYIFRIGGGIISLIGLTLIVIDFNKKKNH